MGERALFIEHPTDRSNAVKVNQVSSFSLPWADPQKIPYTIMGPYLKPLFDRALLTGCMIRRSALQPMNGRAPW
jgi:hypothetical protein